jgi:uncharacterized protein YndB with AHSA1/START domain
MNRRDPSTPGDASAANLVVRRLINASAERLFSAWTEPAHLLRWWGPGPVRCTAAEIDLRVGGRYRIANQFPDGRVLWIAGEFERVSPPRELVYTWCIEPDAGATERVTVRFEPRGRAVDVIVMHERIPSAAIRDQHERGWEGCLDRLSVYLNDPGAR